MKVGILHYFTKVLKQLKYKVFNDESIFAINSKIIHNILIRVRILLALSPLNLLFHRENTSHINLKIMIKATQLQFHF